MCSRRTTPEDRCFTNQSAEPMTYNVLIIGAGLAGLTAARKLAGTGARVLVLEARDRAGGRVHTLYERGGSAPMESGAEFIHGSVAELDELIRESGVAVDEVKEGHHFFAN